VASKQGDCHEKTGVRTCDNDRNGFVRDFGRVTHHRVISQAPLTTVYYNPWQYGAYSAYAYYPYGGYYYPGYYRSYARCYSDWGSYWCW
jgi:hypothetical protein